MLLAKYMARFIKPAGNPEEPMAIWGKALWYVGAFIAYPWNFLLLGSLVWIVTIALIITGVYE